MSIIAKLTSSDQARCSSTSKASRSHKASSSLQVNSKSRRICAVYLFAGHSPCEYAVAELRDRYDELCLQALLLAGALAQVHGSIQVPTHQPKKETSKRTKKSTKRGERDVPRKGGRREGLGQRHNTKTNKQIQRARTVKDRG